MQSPESKELRAVVFPQWRIVPTTVHKTVKRHGGKSSTLSVFSRSNQGQWEPAARSEDKFRAGIFIQMEQALGSNRQGAVELCVPTMF